MEICEQQSANTDEVKVLEKILRALNNLKSDIGFIQKRIVHTDQMSTADIPVQKQREEQGSKSTEQPYHHAKANQFAGIAGQKITSEPLARFL